MGTTPYAPTDLRPSPAKRTIPQEVPNVSIYDKGPGHPEGCPGSVGAKVRPGRGGEALTRLWTAESNTVVFKGC